LTRSNNLSRAERKELNDALKAQRDYLAAFAKDVQDGNLSPKQIAARAAMYAGAVRGTYYAARWGAWDIPPDLMPGQQECVANCRCTISITDNGDGTGILNRKLNGERHCPSCEAVAGDHPIERKRG
jgi:hypothetical protein